MSNQANNIIFFPQNKLMPSTEQMREQFLAGQNVNLIKEKESAEAADILTSALINNISSSGFDVQNPEAIKDLTLVTEALKAYVDKYYGVQNGLHAFTNAVMEADETYGPNYLLFRTDILNDVVKISQFVTEDEPNQN